jgi:hypothetical protein
MQFVKVVQDCVAQILLPAITTLQKVQVSLYPPPTIEAKQHLAKLFEPPPIKDCFPEALFVKPPLIVLNSFEAVLH